MHAGITRLHMLAHARIVVRTTVRPPCIDSPCWSGTVTDTLCCILDATLARSVIVALEPPLSAGRTRNYLVVPGLGILGMVLDMSPQHVAV